MIEKYFKLVLIGMGIVFLAMFFQYSNNGRYQYYYHYEESKFFVAFDTRDGTFNIYNLRDNGQTWLLGKGKSDTKDKNRE